jgi:hypothetical protein
MGVKIKNPVDQPAVTYDLLHVDELVVKHQRLDDAPTIIKGYGTIYGHLPDGKKRFHTDLFAVNCENMQQKMFEESVKSGKSQQETMIDYFTVKQELAQQYAEGKITDWTLMVMFELAIGRIFEILSNRIKVDNLS